MLETGARPKQGRYEPLVELASGGMATTYLARHAGAAGFERLVVLKRVHPRLLEDNNVYAMLAEEARIASLVRHPNVVPVIDVIQDRGELMLVLEYVESIPLETLLASARREGAPLPPSIVARILADVLAGLHAAHEAVDIQGRPLDLVHRDVHPNNVLVGCDGTSRLIDFGIAKAARRLTTTTAGVIKGKMGYMAVEQLRQKRVDRRTDVFSAGVVLYVALTGRLPFVGADEGDLLLAMMLGEPPPPSTLVAGIEPTIDAIVAYALASNPDERFQTAAAFQQALETAAPPANAREVASLVATHGGERIARLRAAVCDAIAVEHAPERAPHAGLAPSSPSPGSIAEAPSTTEPSGQSHRKPHRRAVAAAALAVAVLAAGGAMIRLAGGRSRFASAPASEPVAASSEHLDAEAGAIARTRDAGANESLEPTEAPAVTSTAAPSTSATAAAAPTRHAPGNPGTNAARRTDRDELRANPYGQP